MARLFFNEQGPSYTRLSASHRSAPNTKRNNSYPRQTAHPIRHLKDDCMFDSFYFLIITIDCELGDSPLILSRLYTLYFSRPERRSKARAKPFPCGGL